jgi:maltose phosphorylase
MRYTAEEIEKLQQQNMEAYNRVVTRCRVKDSEISDWETKSSEMFFPYDADLDIFLQQDGFLDKEIIPVSELNPSERPIVEHWSWDRILRSCYIKQADVLQGMYFFEDEFDHDTLRRHYDFYEPLTVHESSLSPCVHSILAARLGDEQRAYEFYLRTSRLDLDDYNNDTRDGCHITSMAGTWMSITRGFAAMKVENDLLSFSPFIPGAWNSYSFKVRFRQNLLEVMVTQDVIEVKNLSGPALDIRIYDQSYHLKQDITIHRNQTTH